MTKRAGATSGERKRRRSGTTEGTVRKNFNLPQPAIDRAREVLGTTTETETVIRALEAVADLAVFREATDAALADLVGGGGFDDPFAPVSKGA